MLRGCGQAEGGLVVAEVPCMHPAAGSGHQQHSRRAPWLQRRDSTTAPPALPQCCSSISAECMLLFCKLMRCRSCMLYSRSTSLSAVMCGSMTSQAARCVEAGLHAPYASSSPRLSGVTMATAVMQHISQPSKYAPHSSHGNMLQVKLQRTQRMS